MAVRRRWLGLALSMLAGCSGGASSAEDSQGIGSQVGASEQPRDAGSGEDENRLDAGEPAVGDDALSDAADVPEADLPGDDEAADDAGASEIVVADIEAHWSNPTWGEMVLRRVGAEVHGTYTHDQGTLVGTYADGLFVGWWSEVPSRLAPNDAGEVELRFERMADGSIYFDGHWRYGVEGAWREDWDLTIDPSDAPAELLTRFDDPLAFLPHP